MLVISSIFGVLLYLDPSIDYLSLIFQAQQQASVFPDERLRSKINSLPAFDLNGKIGLISVSIKGASDMYTGSTEWQNRTKSDFWAKHEIIQSLLSIYANMPIY